MHEKENGEKNDFCIQKWSVKLGRYNNFKWAERKNPNETRMPNCGKNAGSLYAWWRLWMRKNMKMEAADIWTEGYILEHSKKVKICMWSVPREFDSPPSKVWDTLLRNMCKRWDSTAVGHWAFSRVDAVSWPLQEELDKQKKMDGWPTISYLLLCKKAQVTFTVTLLEGASVNTTDILTTN